MLLGFDHKQKSDSDCPRCGSNMVLREPKRGTWGGCCSHAPVARRIRCVQDTEKTARRAVATTLRPLELDHLRGMDIGADPKFREQFFARRGVEL